MSHIEEIHSSNIVQVLRMQSAIEQAALHSVKLAVARWTSADVEFELASALPSSRRSRWHAAAQNDFMAWLREGGFARQDELDASTPAAGYGCPL